MDIGKQNLGKNRQFEGEDVWRLYILNKQVCLVRFSVCYRDKNSTSNMKIDTLAFLNCLLSNHSPVVFHSHIKIIIPVSIFSHLKI